MLSVGIQTVLGTILVDLTTLLLVGPGQIFGVDGLLLELFAELLVQRLARHLGPLFLPDCREPRVLGTEQHVRHRRGRQLAAQEPRQLDDVRGFAFDLIRCASILFALLRLALHRFACSGLVWSGPPGFGLPGCAGLLVVRSGLIWSACSGLAWSVWVWFALMLWSAGGVVRSDVLVCLL